MVKQMYKLCCFSLLFMSLVTLLHSCGMTYEERKRYNSQQEELERIKYQAELKRRYQATLQEAGDKVLKQLVQIASPMSGRDAKVTMDMDNIYYDRAQNVVSVNADFYWRARDFMSGVAYGDCKTNGAVLVYLPQRSVDKTQVKYVHKRHNQHLIDVTSKSELGKITQGFVFPLSK